LGDKFNLAATFLYNNFQLPNGDFTANILRTQLSYAFKPNIYLQGLIQHNTTDKLWAANVRFGWLQQAINNSFIIKYTRIFDLVK